MKVDNHQGYLFFAQINFNFFFHVFVLKAVSIFIDLYKITEAGNKVSLRD